MQGVESRGDPRDFRFRARGPAGRTSRQGGKMSSRYPVAQRGGSCDDPLRELPRTWVVPDTAVPSKIRSEMHTVDPLHRVGAPREDEADPRYLAVRARAVVAQLELAAREKAGGETTLTCLAFCETRNDVTGEWGVIVRKLLSPGCYSRALAELLWTAGEMTPDACDQADWLGWSAANRQLEIIVYAERDQKRSRPAAFAVTRDADRPSAFVFLARLLVTPFEISQWTDLTVELKAIG
jgi:hypothetical protein